MPSVPVLIDGLLIGLLAACLLSGRVAPARAFAVFSLAAIVLGRIQLDTALAALGTPAIWAVVSLVVFSLALGKLSALRRLFFGRKPVGLRRSMARMLGVAAATSAVVPNTAVVAAMLGPASRRPNITAHQLLLPLSYLCLAAGMITPFGTSASLMVVGQADLAGVTLSVGDFVLPGLFATGGVLIALLVFAPMILREQASDVKTETEVFAVEATISAGSNLVGKTVADAGLRSLHSFYLAELIRGERVIAPARPSQALQAGDLLLFVGDINHIDELKAVSGLSIHPGRASAKHHKSYRAVISADSMLIGKTLREADFRARFDASVLGIQRADEAVSGKLGRVRLAPGDLLLLAAGPDFHSRDNLRANMHLLDSDESSFADLSTRDTVLLGLAFAGFLIAALFQLAPIALAALSLAAGSVFLNWVSPREAKRNFPFDLVIVLWGAVLLSMLVQQSGLSAAIANGVSVVASGSSGLIALICIFVMGWILTEFFSNTSAALITLPVALDTALAVGQSPEAFALAAAFGASASFFMPFGYQTHLMVLGPGRYRNRDFFRLGALTFFAYAGPVLFALSLFAL